MSSPEEGGTKIQKRNSAPPMMGGGGPPQMAPQMAPQGMPQQMDPRMSQQMDPRMSQQMDPRMSQEQMMMMMQQQEQMQQQQYQQQPQGYQMNSMGAPKKSILRKSSFGGVPMDSSLFKNTLLVIIIFVALNSKIIWKQIIRFPFMGGIEPSIVALVVNSILAGVIFYLISYFLMKN